MTTFYPVLIDHYMLWSQMRPLTINKPISALRIGISTIKEKWEGYLDNEVGVKTCQQYLSCFDSAIKAEGEIAYINSSVLPNKELAAAITTLQVGETLYHQGEIIAVKTTADFKGFETEVQYPKEVHQINYPWDIFAMNDIALKDDFERLTLGKSSQPLPSSNTLIGPANQLYIAEGATIEASILNTNNGPIYIGEQAEVMEGALVRGPLALCDNAVLKLGAKVYGGTTIGPYSKVGGEINNSVIQGYSNKGHDGFLGNSVIGEWCNLGADTNNSNLKNNYGEVKAYSYEQKEYIPTGKQFLGLIMGDHSKCGINTMFNTGTVVGVFANIFGGDFPPKFIPSFSWGGSAGFSNFKWDKALEVATRVMERRSKALNPNEEAILKYIYETVN